MIKSDRKIRFYIYVIALIPFTLLLVTGLILLKYHVGAPPEATVMGLNAHFWFPFHRITALITIPLILLHLFVKTDWVKCLFTLKAKGAFNTQNTILFVVFLLAVISAFGSCINNHAFGGIHNKFGLLLIIMFVIHIWNYRKVIIKQFTKENKH